MNFATPTSPLLVRDNSRRHSAPPLLAGAMAMLFGVQGLSVRAIVTAFGVALFVDIVILTLGAATLWSVAGLLHLPMTLTLALALAIFVPCKWLCWKVAQLALQAEAREPLD